MPLDVRRLLTSETWIEAADDPKLGHALVCLWCESWHQVPAGSLPENPKVLARLAMCTADEWQHIAERALAGWQRCSGDAARRLRGRRRGLLPLVLATIAV